jgi:hypothetical protein
MSIELPPIRALSVRQPWASALLLTKDIENRSWATHYRGPLLIHASRGRLDRPGLEFCRDRGLDLDEKPLPHGVILGVVTLVGCHGSHACLRTSRLGHLHPDGPYTCSPWAMGGATGDGPTFHWERADPVLFAEPVPHAGHLSLWVPSEEAMPVIERQMGLRTETAQRVSSPLIGASHV